MPIANSASNFMYGANEISRVMLGSHEIWTRETPEPIPNPKYITAYKINAEGAITADKQEFEYLYQCVNFLKYYTQGFYQHVVIGELANVTTLYSTFDGCTYLKSLVIPKTVTKVYGKFMNTSIEELVFPDSVTNIGAGDDLLNLRVSKELKRIEFTGKLQVEPDASYVPPPDVSYCPKLKEIILSNGTQRLSKGYWMECTALEEIHIPSSVTRINQTTFSETTALKRIYIAKSKGSISYAPWGAPSGCQVFWTG